MANPLAQLFSCDAEMLGKGLPSREHLHHHATGGDNPGRPFLSWLGIAVVGAVIFLGGAGWLLGGLVFGAAWLGVPLYAGWLLGYGIYERIHERSHDTAPRGRYTAWVRRHHFHHHHGHPMANHGVTVPLWDKVFGTLEVADVIRVPAQALQPGEGAALTSFLGDLLGGKGTRATPATYADVLVGESGTVWHARLAVAEAMP